MNDTRPARQICPVCAHDDDVQLHRVDDEWIFTCSWEGHPPYEWRPTVQKTSVGTFRTGLGVELGVYDDLLLCVVGGWAEYGVIEYRFSQRSPRAFHQLVDHYGHRALAPSAYTAASFLGGALGQLWREGAIEGQMSPATGYWRYNGQIGTYAPTGTPPDGPILTWSAFATETLGLDEDQWPALA